MTGPDGNLWFTEAARHVIGKLDPGTVTPRPAPCLVVTESITLTGEVGPCSGAGIVVTASNVTDNLNGHKVFAAPGPRYGEFPGILLLGVSAVTVVKGEVTGFDAGVAIEGGSLNTLSRLNIHDNLSPPDPGSNYGDGIVVFHSSDNQIVNNVVHRNGMYDGIGVLGVDSNNNVIRANKVTHNTDRGYPGPEGEGTGIIFNPFLELSSPRRGESLIGNKVIDNVVRDNVNSGISSLSNVNGVIRGNIVEHNGYRRSGRQGNGPGNGIGVQANFLASPSTHDLVEANIVRDNYNSGIQVMSNSNRIVANTVSGNGFAGIDLFYGLSNTMLRNTSTGTARTTSSTPRRTATPTCGGVTSGAERFIPCALASAAVRFPRRSPVPRRQPLPERRLPPRPSCPMNARA